MFDFFPII